MKKILPKRVKIKSDMQKEISQFKKILIGLEKGDKDLNLPSQNNKDALDKLQNINNEWQGFETEYNIIVSSSNLADNEKSLNYINTNINKIVNDINDVVSLLDNNSNKKVLLAKELSSMFLIIALIIIVSSLFTIRKTIINHLEDLVERMKIYLAGMAI